MAKITYLAGEGHPAEIEWKGIKLKANVAREINDDEIIERARTNPFFAVEEGASKRRVVEGNSRRA
jgi:hypothetical protein